MNNFSDFSPLKFLEIDGLKKEEKKEISKKLLSKILQYLLICVVNELDLLSIKNKNMQEIFLVAKEKIPDFDNKIKKYLENFKREFNSNLNSL